MEFNRDISRGFPLITPMSLLVRHIAISFFAIQILQIWHYSFGIHYSCSYCKTLFDTRKLLSQIREIYGALPMVITYYCYPEFSLIHPREYICLVLRVFLSQGSLQLSCFQRMRNPFSPILECTGRVDRN